MKKCDYCDKEATQVTTLYAPEGASYGHSERSVCNKHYLEFEHGIETVECDSCKLPTMLDHDYYYHLEQIFCAHCGHLMENKDWIHRIKSFTSEGND